MGGEYLIMDDLNKEKEVAIKISHLNKSYSHRQVLFDIDLEINKGELFGFIGKNGVGKSTTIECLIGAKTFDSGDIFLNGIDCKKYPLDVKKIIGYVASEPVCYEDMKGSDFLEFIASIYKVNAQTYISNLNFLLDKLEFDEKDLYRRIAEYSHGMKQKICLMASLIHNPKIWILDEPTVGLDPMTSNELSILMKDYVKHGNTIFIASHNIDLVSKLCDRVAIIKDGKIVNIFDLKNNPILRNKIGPYFLNLYKKDEKL